MPMKSARVGCVDFFLKNGTRRNGSKRFECRRSVESVRFASIVDESPRRAQYATFAKLRLFLPSGACQIDKMRSEHERRHVSLWLSSACIGHDLNSKNNKMGTDAEPGWIGKPLGMRQCA